MAVQESCHLVDTITTEEGMILFLEAIDSSEKFVEIFIIRILFKCLNSAKDISLTYSII